MTSSQHNNDDPRWGGRIPWYLRHPGAAVSGNVDSWLGLVGQRIERLFVFNEMGVLNEAHFGSSLETETLGRFKFDLGRVLGPQLRAYFEPESLRRDAQNDAMRDPEEQRSAAAELARRFRRKGGAPAAAPTTTPEEEDAEAFRARENARSTRDARTAAHWAGRVGERIATLEAVMRLVSTHGTDHRAGLPALIADIRRFSAASHVPLDARAGPPPQVLPLEEPLLQREILDPLLTRLSARWPERARELVTAYHDAMAGEPLDEVFSNAFKSLEEIARALTSDPKFEFTERELKQHFPSLHPTTRIGIVKLAAHRGDSAAHGRNAPHPSEIRFLLLQICNVALLLLDTQTTD